MIKYSGMKAEESNGFVKHLPAGPYVARIKAAKVDGQEPDQTLIIRLDVCEGPHADYFMNRYKADDERYRRGGQYEPKYKGDYRLRIPNKNNPNSQYPMAAASNMRSPFSHRCFPHSQVAINKTVRNPMPAMTFSRR